LLEGRRERRVAERARLGLEILEVVEEAPEVGPEFEDLGVGSRPGRRGGP
jgi:hypothetical protein